MPDHEHVIDPDVDLRDPAQRGETTPREWDLVAATAGGGILGAWARYGVDLAVPHHSGAFPWSTIVINASGCLLIGALMAVLLDLRAPPRLARPFLGVGVLGGYTTFSTFAVDAETLVRAHRPLIALVYVIVTLAVCAAAMWVSTVGTRSARRAVAERADRRGTART